MPDEIDRFHRPILQHKLPAFVDYFLRAVFEMRRYGTAGGGDDVGVDGGIVEAELFGMRLRERLEIAVEGVLVAHTNSEVRVPLRAAHILVEQGLGHEFRDARVATIRERVFPHLVGVLCRYHLLQEFLVRFRCGFYDASVLPPQLNSRNLRAVAIERLIETYPAVSAAPGKPLTLLAEAYPEIGIGAFDMELIDLRRELVELVFIHLYLTIDFFPLLYRVFVVKEACFDYLVPVFFFREPGFFRHRGSAVEPDGPCEFPLVFLLVPPIHEGLEGDPALHDLFRIDAFKRMRILIGKEEERVVHHIDEAAQIFRGKEIDLFVVRMLVEIAADADIAALVALLFVRRVIGDDVPAGVHDDVRDRRIQGLRRLARREPDYISLLDAFPHAEREIHENVGVFRKDLVAGRVRLFLHHGRIPVLTAIVHIRKHE